MGTANERDTGHDDPQLDALLGERRHLFNLAYRLLGSMSDAEDVVQATYVRWYAQTPQQQEAIRSPGAWLTTVASRICLDELGSARSRREQYVGEWIPEPLPTGREALAGRSDHLTIDPGERVTLDESVSMAFLIVLESLTPPQRVAFVLHDVFRYSFAEIADIVGRTPAACRQLASKARARIDTARPATAPSERQADVVRKFKQAWETADIEGLMNILDPEAVVIADGGGVVAATPYPVRGSDAISQFFVRLAGDQVDDQGNGLVLYERTVNGQPGLVAELKGVIVTVFAFLVGSDRIEHIWAVRNPEKLRPWLAD